jgi:hypothetical protein
MPFNIATPNTENEDDRRRHRKGVPAHGEGEGEDAADGCEWDESGWNTPWLATSKANSQVAAQAGSATQ